MKLVPVSSHKGLNYGLARTLMCVVLISSTHGNFTAHQDDGSKTLLCLKWASNENLRHIILEAQRNASPCPCTIQQAELEHTFEKTDNCFTEYFYTDGVKQRCCYDTTGKLLINKPGAGYLVVEAFSKNITEVYQNCCHGDMETCQRFYDINPSNNCSGYTSPRYLTSGGDVHITTINGVEYDFNGHGEYVFLKHREESLEIQIRTDYLVAGKVDSTIITAVAIKVKSMVLTVLLNKTSHTAALFINSTFQSFSSKVKPIRGDPVTLYPSNDSFHIACKTASGGLMINIKAGDSLDLQLANEKGNIINESTGLAGSSNNGTMLSGNGTRYSVNISEHDFFDFGETWSLHKESDSAFDYKLTNGSFSVYNKHHTKPNFLEDLVDNLTALFENKTDDEIANYTKTCEGNKECLLAIARSGDIHQGELIMMDVHREQLRKELAANTPPFFFSNWTRTLNISYSKTYFVLDLKTVAGDNQDSADQLKFNVITKLNKTDFDLTDGIFNWTYISPSLRYDDIAITFLVSDHLNQTNFTPVSILYCGCEKDSQCIYDDVATTGGKFARASCDCSGDIFADGKFCEIDKPPCTVIECSPLVRCHNDSVNKSNPCEPCPTGYDGDGTYCIDRNECDPKIERQYCDQNCSNHIGSYTCSCWDGYELGDDNKTCNDVNECDASPDPCSHTDKNMRCRNQPGSYECICMPGFYKNGQTCVSGGYSYVGSLSLSISYSKTEVTEAEKKNITDTLTQLFINVEHFVSVEVLVIKFGVINRLKRNTVPQNRVQIDYKIITDEQTNRTVLQEDIKESVLVVLKNRSVTLLDAPVNLDTFILFDESDNMLCKNDTRICDPLSSHCQEKNGTTQCDCNSGFQRYKPYATFCHDIDECDNATVLKRCHKGRCRNIPGSWECVCPADLNWKSVGNDSYRCEGDYQYVGNINLTWWKTYNETEVTSHVLELLNTSFNNSTVLTSVGLMVWQIFVRAEVDNSSLQLSNQSGPEKTWIKYKISLRYILHFGESLNWMEVYNLQNWTTLQNINLNTSLRTIEDIFIFNETKMSICNIPGKVSCDEETTNCITEHGVPKCICKPGYSNDSKSSKFCKVIDECASKPCSHGGTCINQPGKRTCACPIGFSLNATSQDCEDTDECEKIKDICKDGSCNNTIGSFICVCNEGFQLRGSVCEDINECTPEKCSHGGTCINLHGNWTCICPAGFTFNTTVHDCKDTDECLVNKDICENGRCKNTNGSYQCLCDDGYQNKEDDLRVCEDIDECKIENSCNGTCFNHIGSWNCTCPTGYTGTTMYNKRSVACININECDTSKYGYPACLEATGCIDTDGAWQCLCEYGSPRKLNSTTEFCGGDYQYAKTITFTLISGTVPDKEDLKTAIQKQLQLMFRAALATNTSVYVEILSITEIVQHRGRREATNGSSNWSVDFAIHTNMANQSDAINNVFKVYGKCLNSACQEETIVNTKTYIIHFQPGLKDIKLCSTTKNYCDPISTICDDKYSKINCTCKSGFEKISETSCEDINECNTPSKAKCIGIGSRCENTQGSWSCKCKDGFQPTRISETEKYCDDIDECTDGSYSCTADNTSNADVAVCKNSFGGWTCNCSTGYKLQTIAEGKKYQCIYGCGDSPCLNDGVCDFVNNNYVCRCQTGWKGKFCDVSSVDAEASYLKTILIACGGAAAGLIVLLLLAIFGVWRYRFTKSKNKEDKVSLHTIGSPDSWPFKNGYTAPDDLTSIQSDRVSIPRARLGNSVETLHRDDKLGVRNPAPDYDLHFPEGAINPAPDYGMGNSPVMRRSRQDHDNYSKPRPGSFNDDLSNKYVYSRPSKHRNSMPPVISNADSYL